MPVTSSRRSLVDGVLDLLVIGGGIVGAGVVRDAARRGLRAGLVEQRDFAWGTSSRSSRLLHGGIRYLAQGRIRMVREASREKTILADIAPHLVQPLAFVYPSFRGLAPPRWKLAVGVKLYDALCGGRNFGPSEVLSPSAVVDRAPGLDQRRLTGGVRYYDALTHDARLVLDTLRSAAAAGASLHNFVRYESANRVGKEWRVKLSDTENGETMEVRARVVVNAAGVWAGLYPPAAVRIHPTQGVHLVVRRSRLPVEDAVVLPDGRRILFAIPWGPWVTLGTTDTDVADVDDEPRCRAADLDVVMEVANRLFPGLDLTADDVHTTWAGYRPLIADRHGHPSDISRRHQILCPAPGWVDVAGGKLTTYRLMAEQAVDRIVSALPGSWAPCTTARVPLADGLPPAEGISGVLPSPVTRAAVAHYCRAEWARHVDDVMIRRSGWAYGDPDPDAAATRVTQWMGDILGWNADRLRREEQRWLRRRPRSPIDPDPGPGHHAGQCPKGDSDDG